MGTGLDILSGLWGLLLDKLPTIAAVVLLLLFGLATLEGLRLLAALWLQKHKRQG